MGEKNFRRELDSKELKTTMSEIKNSLVGLTTEWTLKEIDKSFYKTHQYYVLNIQRELNFS